VKRSHGSLPKSDSCSIVRILIYIFVGALAFGAGLFGRRISSERVATAVRFDGSDQPQPQPPLVRPDVRELLEHDSLLPFVDAVTSASAQEMHLFSEPLFGQWPRRWAPPALNPDLDSDRLDTLWHVVFSRWAEIDYEGARAFVEKTVSRHPAALTLREVLLEARDFGNLDATMRRALDEGEEVPPAALIPFVEAEPYRILQWLRNHSHHLDYGNIKGRQLLEALHHQDPDASTAFVESLSDPRQRALALSLVAKTRLDSDGLAEAWAFGNSLGAPIDRYSVHRVLVLQATPSQVAPLIAQLPPDEFRTDLLAYTGANWCTEDLDAAISWVEASAIAGKERTHALYSIATQLAAVAPERGLALIVSEGLSLDRKLILTPGTDEVRAEYYNFLSDYSVQGAIETAVAGLVAVAKGSPGKAMEALRRRPDSEFKVAVWCPLLRK
jgi:hypothetical protein